MRQRDFAAGGALTEARLFYLVESIASAHGEILAHLTRV
jgi:hypothetical protein